MLTRKSKSLFYPLVAPLVVLIALVGATAATAAPRETASGDFVSTSTTINGIRTAGPTTFIDLSFTVSYSGTLTGTSVVEGTLTAHKNDSGNFHGVETFTGTVNGVPGTLSFDLVARNNPAGVEHGTARIRGATGELAGLHGVLHQAGTVEGPPGPAGTYSGRIG
jgi:Protein of unknown function (DUF3224)